MKLKIGDRVKLVVPFYGCSSHNPVWGSICGKIIGTVDNIGCCPLSVRVDWDNGETNYYNKQDLSLMDTYIQLNLFGEVEND